MDDLTIMMKETESIFNSLKEKGMVVLENVATINLIESGMSAVIMVDEELVRIDNINGRLVMNYSETDYELHEGNIFLEDSRTPMR